MPFTPAPKSHTGILLAERDNIGVGDIELPDSLAGDPQFRPHGRQRPGAIAELG